MNTAALAHETSSVFGEDSHPSIAIFEAYLAGELTQSECNRFLDHVSWCRDCCLTLKSDSFLDSPVSLSERALKKAFDNLARRILQPSSGDASDPEADARAADPAAAWPQKLDRVLEEILEELKPRLKSRLSRIADAGHDPEAMYSASGFVERMLAAVPEPSFWDQLLGPFYRTQQLAEVLGISRRAIQGRRQRRSLLGMRTEDGVLYPAFQVDDQNQLLGGFPETLLCFQGIPVDDWTLAGWFAARNEALDGYSVVEALRFGVDLDRIIALARDTARRFSQ